MISMQEIETGNFSPPRLVLIPPDSIRVVNWNINRGLRLQRVVEFLASAKADVVLLQESDQNARRTHYLNVAKEIAQKLQMNYVFGREFQELTQGSRSSPAYHGQATLSRWPLSNPRVLRFQKQSNFWRPHWFLPEIKPFQERIGGRLALVCETTIAGKQLVTYNLHLESKGDDALRCSQIDETLEDARQYNLNTPVVLAGDFNLDLSRGPASAAIAKGQFQDAFANRQVATTPHSFLEPGRSIDWMFIRGPIHAISGSVHSSISASDHFPLTMVLSLL